MSGRAVFDIVGIQSVGFPGLRGPDNVKGGNLGKRVGKRGAIRDSNRRQASFSPDGRERSLVPEEGFEPSLGRPRRILSPLRLPFRHSGARALSLERP